MKNLKFKLNGFGQFQPVAQGAPLGHPIYQVINIPDEADPIQVLSLLNSSVLATGPKETSFDWQDLGIGKIVRGK